MNTCLIRYEAQRQFIRTMDVLQWQSNTLLGALIRMKGGGANHTGAAVTTELLGLTRYMTMESMESGFHLHLLSRRMDRYKGKVWWHRVLPEFEQYRQGAAEWMINQMGIPYDFLSLFKNALAHVSADARQLFCSEAYFLAWKEGGKVPHLQGIKHAPRPNEVTKAMKIHGEGVRIY